MKKQLLSSALAVGSLATVSMMQAKPANAFTIQSSGCDFTGAIYCSSLEGGNDDKAHLESFLNDLNSFVGGSPSLVADPASWGNGGLPSGEDFIAKVEQPSLTATEGLLGYLNIAYDQNPGDSTTGTWEVINAFLASGKFDGPFVLAMKAGNQYAFNYFDGTIQSGDWTTDRFGRGFSHASLYAPPESIPTPALLPGLIGMGVAALRKRKQEEGEVV